MIGLTMLLGTSYSLINSVTSNESYGFNLGNFNVEFQDHTKISLNGVPVSDSDGMKNSHEFTFTISNNSDYDVNYRLDILENSLETMGNVIKYSYSLNDSGYDNIYLLSKNYTIMQNKKLGKNDVDVYKLKVWLSLDADESYMNKKFSATINLYATQDEYKYASSVIESLFNKKMDNVLMDDDNYRYGSSSQNNYVWFNCQDGYSKGSDYCEKWRIVGSFDNTWENGIGIYKSLKIVNTDYLDEIAFNNSEMQGDYDKSYINMFLNGAYYDKLNNDTKKLILRAKWNIGSVINDNYYNSLRDEKKKTYYTYIGLLNNSDCIYLKENSWLDKKTLLINKNSDNISYYDNKITYLENDNDYYYLPTLYLKPDVSILSGDGSINNPYELGIKYPMNYGVK